MGPVRIVVIWWAFENWPKFCPIVTSKGSHAGQTSWWSLGSLRCLKPKGVIRLSLSHTHIHLLSSPNLTPAAFKVTVVYNKLDDNVGMSIIWKRWKFLIEKYTLFYAFSTEKNKKTLSRSWWWCGNTVMLPAAPSVCLAVYLSKKKRKKWKKK